MNYEAWRTLETNASRCSESHAADGNGKPWRAAECVLFQGWVWIDPGCHNQMNSYKLGMVFTTHFEYFIGDGLQMFTNGFTTLDGMEGEDSWNAAKVRRVFGPTSEGYEKFKAQHRLT